MADIPHEPKPSPHLRRRKNGVALVVVLGAMALIAFLVLTILTLNRSEQRAATNSAELTDVRNLAELPAQVVISQIRRATQNLGTFFNWTSQPGLIRVFSVEPSADPKATPKIQQFRYPLYSTQTLYAAGPPDISAESSELAEWSSSKALFVDLNEPIEVRQDLTTGAPLPTANPGTLVYPILDPAAFERVGDKGESRVQGLAFNGAPPAASPRHQMPMPVRWLYVLSTGKILSPLPGGDPSIARFDMAQFQPQGSEPAPKIIGRIAFWTDDESCKINLNTASEPAPWHPPMTTSERDRWAADTQPVRGEIHRLHGHPAYTALSPVLRSFGGLAGPVPALQPQVQPPSGQGNGVSPFKDYLYASHSLLPHTPDRDSGSIHGTEQVLNNTAPPEVRTPAAWSNVDEFLFDPGQPAGSGATRQRNGFQAVTGYALDEADIRRARFCLTTHSSAPETNPYNQPKISLWPIQADPAQRTRTDHLMALAATIGGPANSRAYYGIQRASAWSGASAGSSHDTSADLAQTSRNRQLFDWLKSTTDLAFPAFPGSFAEKYGPLNRDHLLLSMFDLIRWSSNPGNAWTDNGPTYDYLAPSNEGTSPPEGSGMVAPLVADTGAGRTLRSPGRIPTITEAAIVFMAVDAKKDLNGLIEEETEGPWVGFAKKTTKIQAFIVLEPYITSPGFPVINPQIKYVIKGLNGPSGLNPESPPEDMSFTLSPHSVNGIPMNFGNSNNKYELINQVTFSPSFPNINTLSGTARRFGGDATSFTGLTALFVERDGQPRRSLGIENPSQEFPWFSIPIDVSSALPEENPVLNYSGGDLVIEIRHATTNALLQELALPPFNTAGPIPMPRLPKDDFAKVGNLSDPSFLLSRFALQVDPANPNAPPYLPIIKRGDVVRAVTLNPLAPHRGDVRMLASRYRIPKEWFSPAPSPVGDPYEQHGLRETTFDTIGQIGSSGVTVPGVQVVNRQAPPATVGSLLPQGALQPLPLTALPQGIPASLARAALEDPFNPAKARFGDWETGPGSLPDGPFFGRQDLTNAVSQEDAQRGLRDNVGNPFSDGGELTIDAAGLSHTPQRQVSSAFIFGALTPLVYGIPEDTNSTAPYGPPDPEPWRTLLFCPNPASRTTASNGAVNVQDHPGFGSPFDHLWLEFFWTPVVEPTFLSPAFSTQGKVNLNCQIFPFTWIERTTALHAAFKGVRIPAIHHSARAVYKAPFDPSSPTQPTAPEILYEVDVEKTLKAFRSRFNGGEVFFHPSEICNTYLFPRRIPGFETDYNKGLSPAPLDPANLNYEQLNEWWNGDPGEPLKLDAFELTGDNLRESPYAQVYPRLCTRSNVFKVHYRVQLITKSRSSPPNEWNVEKEKITAEQRGATVIERYLDPNDPNIPDLTGSSLALDEFYRYRTLATEPFTP